MAVFDVRHVDVDDVFQELEGLNGLIAAAVVDQRKLQSTLGGNAQRADYLRGDMRWRDEVDVVAPRFLQAEHQCGEPGCTDGAASLAGADLIVLAVEATEVAEGEKDRP